MLRSCGTCRTRRRACDKARPACGTCKKSGHMCTGYTEVETKVFVNFDSKNLTRRKKKVLCDAIRERPAVPPISFSVDNDDDHTTPSDSNPASAPTASPKLQFVDGLAVRNAVIPGMADGHSALHEDDIRVSALSCMFMSAGQFRDHVVSLWAHFSRKHTMTIYGWAPGFSQLLMHNYALDLALVSLSTLRLATTTPESEPSTASRMRVMSHSAYDQSMRVFRRICSGNCVAWRAASAAGTLSAVDKRRLALLSVTSLVYAFVEATQHTPAAILEGGASVASDAHLYGCLAFVDAAGPRAFARGGTHRAFRKIRELAVVTAMTNHEPSMLAAPRWMHGPWRFHARTVRDKLYDIITPLTVLVAYALGPQQQQQRRRFRMPGGGVVTADEDIKDKKTGEPVTPREFYLMLQKRLHDWYNDWLANPSAGTSRSGSGAGSWTAETASAKTTTAITTETSVATVADTVPAAGRRAGNKNGKSCKGSNISAPLPPLISLWEEDFEAAYIMVQTEVRAVRLIMALVAMKLDEMEGDDTADSDANANDSPGQPTSPPSVPPATSTQSPGVTNVETTESVLHRMTRMPIASQARADAVVFARSIRDALELPIYNLRGQTTPGIIEGQCRSILPSWALIEYDRVTGDTISRMSALIGKSGDAVAWV